LTLAGVIVHLVLKRPGFSKPDVKLGFNLASFKLLVTLAVVFSTLALMVTGFGSIFYKAGPISGYALMLHATAGGVFAASLAIWAILNGFKYYESNHAPARKAFFWLMLAAAIPAIMSSTLSMFRLFGTDGQVMLLHVHRYSVLVLSICAVIYAYSIVFNKNKFLRGSEECKPQATMAR
jgi:uncharacterized membrane protein